MNRKLIRPTLTDVKSQDRSFQNNRETRIENASRVAPTASDRANNSKIAADSVEQSGSTVPKNRRQPQLETNAEVFYYKKQIDSRSTMIIVLQDGEEIEGTIEWYDRNALKINRKNAPKILLLKHNIKYMFKAEDRISSE